MALKLAENINYSGSLEHQFSFNQISDEDPIITNISSIRLNAGTFFWRPWLATLDTNMAFSYTNRINGNNLSGQDITGKAQLNLFPRSHFPFSTFVSRRNSNIEGDLNSQNMTMTSYGVNQSYSKNASSVNFRYEHIQDDNEDFTTQRGNRSFTDMEDNLELTLDTMIGKHDLSSSSKFSFKEREQQQLSEDQMLHVVRHNYRPDNSLTMNNLFTFNDRTFSRSSDFETEQQTIQINSNTFWRPKSIDSLLVTTNALLQGTGELADSHLGIFDSAGLSGQVSYQWQPYLNLRAQANVSESEDNTRTRQGIGAEYSPADTRVLGFRHTYNLSVDLDNITDQITDNRQEASLSGGHIFNRNFPVKLGNFRLSLTQRANAIADTIGTLDRTLTHSARLDWNHSTLNSSNFAGLTLSDTRRFSSSDNEFGLQQFNLQFSRNQTFSRQSSLNGNVTLQANRTLDNNNAGDNIDFNSNVSLNYTHNNLFGVRRLRLVSEVRYLSNTIFEIINSDGFNDQVINNVSWQNRLYYQIGRLELRLSTNLGQSNIGQDNKQTNTLIFFQIRRHFGN